MPPAATVLFVHGTGVRKGTFVTTYLVIQQAFAQHGIAHALDGCIWGDVLGALPVIRSLPDITIPPKIRSSRAKRNTRGGKSCRATRCSSCGC